MELFLDPLLLEEPNINDSRKHQDSFPDSASVFICEIMAEANAYTYMSYGPGSKYH